MIGGIIKKLIDDVGIQTIIGMNKKGTTRKIYPVRIEQDEEFPAATVSLSSEDPGFVSKGCLVSYDLSTVRVAVFSERYHIVEDFEKAIKVSLDGWSGVSAATTYDFIRFQTANDIYDDQAQVYGRVMEFSAQVKR